MGELYHYLTDINFVMCTLKFHICIYKNNGQTILSIVISTELCKLNSTAIECVSETSSYYRHCNVIPEDIL